MARLALVIGSAALALSVYVVFRGPSAPADDAAACVDRDARDQLIALRRELADRDAAIARLVRATTAAIPRADARPAGGAGSAATPDLGVRRYTHFEIPNPAVTVKQTDSGVFEIHSTDRSLAGTTMVITAVTATGEEEKFFIRIPD